MKITRPTNGTYNYYQTENGKFEVRYNEHKGYEVKTPRGYTERVTTIKEVKEIIK